MTRPGEEQGPVAATLTSAVGRDGANHGLAVCACCCSRDNPTPTKGVRGRWRTPLLGPVLSVGRGARGWDQTARGGGHWGPTAAAHTLPECRQQGAGSPFLSTRRALSSRALLPPQTVALCPLPTRDTGQKGRSHALHSSARERALGWEEGEGKGREQGLGHSKHHLRAERTEGPTGM